ncbi:hypothetical protein DFP72DRAFT_1076335 [Ephemerocybe angulata]|uniref:Uncharacterized protein n=1 Tax=Ephemerocybe angulata TaxID=980116 RepID=A0A8H6HG88_9AGAR|nr:hypothetical protein DFP72DRAFT_1076335 [Tulosesus angulatus]
MPIANRLASELNFCFSIRVCHGTFRPLSVNILEGDDVRANAVSVTLSPKSALHLFFHLSTGLIPSVSKSFGTPKVTKAGVMVAKSIMLKARLEKLACTSSRIPPPRRTRSPETARHPPPSSPLSGPCHLLLGILANGDTNLANLIAQATERVGKKGVCTVKEGRTIGDDRAIIEGMHLNLRGFTSPNFVTDVKPTPILPFLFIIIIIIIIIIIPEEVDGERPRQAHRLIPAMLAGRRVHG